MADGWRWDRRCDERIALIPDLGMMRIVSCVYKLSVSALWTVV